MSKVEPLTMTSPGAGSSPRPLMSEARVAVIGGLMVTIGPVSLTMYTPAMPQLVAAFQTDISMVKLTITVFFLGFAVSQLICGPLSDAYGRRPVALSFFGIYLVGACVAMLAQDMSWLLAGRALQGVGCAAGIAISRAIVRDQFTGQASARVMNHIGTLLAIGPALSPTIGGLLLGVASWHVLFVAMSVFGVLLMGLIVVGVPETNRYPDRALAAPRRILKSYGELLRSRVFLRASLVLAFALGGVYTLATLVPFILIDRVGLTPPQFGLAMMIQSGSFIVGTLVAGRFLKRTNALKLVPYGLVLAMCGATGLSLGPQFLPLTTATIMVPIGFWTFGIAFIVPGCTTTALAGFAHIAGAASALMGFMQIGGGSFGSALSVLFPTPLAALATLLPAMAFSAMATHFLLRPPAGAPVRAPEPVVEATDLELAADPLGVIGAAGDEIEAETYARRR
jgi:DHA1 family bicyclomycin/chloramphenicol resistance-like MFS transporter